MATQDGTIEPRAESAVLSARASNILSFPRQGRLPPSPGLSLLLDAKDDLTQVKEDLAFLDAFLAQIRDFALSAEAMNDVESAITEAITEANCPSRPIP